MKLKYNIENRLIEGKKKNTSERNRLIIIPYFQLYICITFSLYLQAFHKKCKYKNYKI